MYEDLVARLRAVKSRSKGELLEEAAQAIEALSTEVEMLDNRAMADGGGFPAGIGERAAG